MDRAQQPFTAAGLDVPSYVAFGNHDGLVQGNLAANAVFEKVATGCIKPLERRLPPAASTFLDFTVQDVLDLLTHGPAGDALLVPPDPRPPLRLQERSTRRSSARLQADGHGFDYVDPAEQAASGGAAGYYCFGRSRACG